MTARLARRYLSEVDRIGETAFAVIMVIIINGYVSLSDLNTGFAYLVSVNLGACLAWGIIDGFIYALSNAMERNDAKNKLKLLKSLKDDEATVERVEESLDDTLLSAFDDAGKKAIAKDIIKHVGNASVGKATLITRTDALGWLAIIGIYLSTGFVLALPFLVLADKLDAWFISNTLGCIWLFWYGVQLGKRAGKRSLLIGFLMTAVGIVFLVNAYIVNVVGL